MEVRNQASNIPQKGLIVLSEDDEYERRPFDGRLLKRVLAYLAPYRRQVAGMALLALLAIGAALALPYILKIGIEGSRRGDPDRLIILGRGGGPILGRSVAGFIDGPHRATGHL